MKKFILFIALSSLNCFGTDKVSNFKIDSEGRYSWGIETEVEEARYEFKPNDEFIASILEDTGFAYGKLVKKDQIAPEAFKVNEYKAFLSWATDKENLASPDEESVANRSLLNFEFTDGTGKTTYYHVSVHDPKLATGFEEVLPSGGEIELLEKDPSALAADDEVAKIMGAGAAGGKGKEPARLGSKARLSLREDARSISPFVLEGPAQLDQGDKSFYWERNDPQGAGRDFRSEDEDAKYEDDLKKAIAMSMQEQQYSGSTRGAGAGAGARGAGAGAGRYLGSAAYYPEGDEDYDAELQAAIRASLRQ